MPQQGHGKIRRARRIGEQGPGILRMRPPARDGGAGRRPCRLADADAQQEQRDAGSFRRARQTQGRSEIARARAAENFDHGGAETPASRGVDSRPQDGPGVPSKHQGKDSRIGAEFR
jgi:hypothetical protein